MKVLVTGANGFIGRKLVVWLRNAGHFVRGAVRGETGFDPTIRAHELCSVGSIDASTDWTAALQDIGAVMHLAARVHVMRDAENDPLSAYLRVNRDGTQRLAEQSVAFGIQRFVYVSSIKVNGEKTGISSFQADDAPAPVDPYGVSKKEAETRLREIASVSSMDAVIVRPPLVYGPGVGGNFLRLLKVIEAGVPLPLGSVNNARSMIFIDNLCDVLTRCVEHSAASGRVFLVADGEDWSTPDLIRRIAYHMGLKPRLLPFPQTLLRLAGSVSGHRAAIDRLCDSLKVDISPTRKLLHWEASYQADEGVRQTVDWYMQHRNAR